MTGTLPGRGTAGSGCLAPRDPTAQSPDVPMEELDVVDAGAELLAPPNDAHGPGAEPFRTVEQPQQLLRAFRRHRHVRRRRERPRLGDATRCRGRRAIYGRPEAHL